jgi:transcriptional regulator
MPRRTESAELLRGTLELLILRVLDLQPLHGIGIADRIRQVTGNTFDVGAGSLFPALHRLDQRGRIRGEWTTSPEGRRIKTYALTPEGRRQLRDEKKQWHRAVDAVNQVLDME